MRLKEIGPFAKLQPKGNNVKLALCVREGDHAHGAGSRYIEHWSPDCNNGFAYWAYHGGRRNFTRIGQVCLGFIRIDASHYLFVTAGEISKLCRQGMACEFRTYDEFAPYVGRLVVRPLPDPTGAMQYGGYIFNAKNYWEQTEVVGMLPEGYRTERLATAEGTEWTEILEEVPA